MSFLNRVRNRYYWLISNLLPGKNEEIRLRQLAANVVKPSAPTTQSLPGHALIEINNTCNLNCTMCNTNISKRQKGNMEPALFERIIDQLQQVGSLYPGLHTVGETFMYPDLPALFDIARAKDYPLFVSTNGQFPSRLAALLESHSDMIHRMRISIDAAEPETYSSIRRGGKLEKVMESLDVVRHHNATAKHPVNLEAGFVVSATNYSEVGGFLRMLEPYCSPDKVRFNMIDGISPDASYFRTTFPFKGLIKPARPCRMVFRNVFFTYDGKVSLCCRDYDAEVVVGDIRRHDLAEIWMGAEAECVRDMHLDKKPLDIKSCAGCFLSNRPTSNLLNLYIQKLYKSHIPPEEIGPMAWNLVGGINERVDSVGDVFTFVQNEFYN